MPDLNERLGADWDNLSADQRSAIETAAKKDGSWWFSAAYDDAAIRRHAASFLHAKAASAAAAPEPTLEEKAISLLDRTTPRWRETHLGEDKLRIIAGAKQRVQTTDGDTANHETRFLATVMHKPELSTVDRMAWGDAKSRDATEQAGLARPATSSNISSWTRSIIQIRQSLPGLRKNDPLLAIKAVSVIEGYEDRLRRAGANPPAP